MLIMVVKSFITLVTGLTLAPAANIRLGWECLACVTYGVWRWRNIYQFCQRGEGKTTSVKAIIKLRVRIKYECSVLNRNISLAHRAYCT
jgi:hypothetical protein